MTIKMPQSKILFFAAISLIALFLILATDAYLITSVTPNGIVSFEFCGFNQTCQTAITEWGNKGNIYAAFSLGVDYLFLVGYGGLLFLWGQKLGRSQGRMGTIMPYFAVFAGISDAIENADLLRVLLTISDGMIGGIFATIKFGLLAIYFLWLLYSLIATKQ